MNLRYALATVVTAGAIVLPAAAAHANVSVAGASAAPPTSNVLPISNGFVTAPAVEGSSAVKVVPATAPASLPFTGGDVAGLSVIGAGLLGAGLVLVRRTRVRPEQVRS
jgi:hypothetical protein